MTLARVLWRKRGNPSSALYLLSDVLNRCPPQDDCTPVSRNVLKDYIDSDSLAASPKKIREPIVDPAINTSPTSTPAKSKTRVPPLHRILSPDFSKSSPGLKHSRSITNLASSLNKLDLPLASGGSGQSSALRRSKSVDLASFITPRSARGKDKDKESSDEDEDETLDDVLRERGFASHVVTTLKTPRLTSSMVDIGADNDNISINHKSEETRSPRTKPARATPVTSYLSVDNANKLMEHDEATRLEEHDRGIKRGPIKTVRSPRNDVPTLGLLMGQAALGLGSVRNKHGSRSEDKKSMDARQSSFTSKKSITKTIVMQDDSSSDSSGDDTPLREENDETSSRGRASPSGKLTSAGSMLAMPPRSPGSSIKKSNERLAKALQSSM